MPLLLLSSARPGGASSQVFSPPPVPAWSGLVENTVCVALGDVDGDGDLDLVRGNLAEGSTLYLNVGGTFGSAPAWTGPVENTRAVALGDVDGDGDLDLIVGNDGGAAELFLNHGNGFDTTAVWTGPVENTFSVALGDVDGDGDLDLVRGNALGQPTTLYLNTGGRFSQVPDWKGPSANTQSVALGDVDGDGDLDLVCGDNGAGASLYLNLGGTFTALPVWNGPAEATVSVALGDVDEDGRLDLVVGGPGAGASLHRNLGGTFDAAAAWTSPAGNTFNVTLGDVDGDGDLDLVIGNLNEPTTLRLNAGGSFGDQPEWTGPTESTRCVVLGDVDGDGDLDLVRGNFQGAATLYVNSNSLLSPVRSWSGSPAQTFGVALGDVDGDGDLDLVRGNLNQPGALHLNDAGTIDSTSSWPGPAESTLSVALGDVDGDGDLDLVRGNQSHPATLYLNLGGTFDAAPAWRGPAENTVSVALGDVDGDGRPDLVRGNFQAGSTLYLNDGAGFADTLAWIGPPHATQSVALGDVDGDGDLDLVLGNEGEGSMLFLNAGGTFERSAAWTGPPANTFSVALGDVDGDGDLDLVCGNAGGPATLFLNGGGRFGSEPAWTGPVENTTSVALGDVDGDGDLDLLRGNANGPATLYLNVGGVFASTPNWIGPSENTFEVALGDVDGDGGLDVVRGNIAGISSMYAKKSAWMRGPSRLTNDLPNNPAHIRWVRPAQTDSSRISLSFRAFDEESDPLWLVGEFEFEGSGDWHPMVLDGAALRTGPFTTSVVGIAHSVVWDVSRLPFDRRNVVIRLRAVSPPRRGGAIQFDPTYLATVGPITPPRAAISASPASLTFPTVTVGDTTVAEVRLSNPGTRALIVDRIDAPDSSVVVSPATGLVVPPGGARIVEVLFMPRRVLASPGPLLVHSNDPLNPVVGLPLLTDVRALAFETRVLAVSPELPLGEAATVVVSPESQVHLEGGFVYFRARGAAQYSDSASLVAQGSNLAALIPGSSVTEAGLEFFVRVENSGIFATDPPSAPESSFFQPVASPTTIAATALEASTGGHPVGSPLISYVTLPQGARFQRGELFYRSGGAASYDSLQLEITQIVPGLSAPAATIPGGRVAARGLEYWVRIETQTATLTDPAQAPAANPHIVRTDVSALAEPFSHPAERYRLVSVPLELNLAAASSLEAIASDQPEFGPYDPTRWRSFRWQPGSESYLEISPANVATGALRPEPGRAFWLVARDRNRLDTAPVAGRSTIPTLITLETGWNQVGDPYDFPVAWNLASASDGTDTVSLEPPRAWDENAGAYDPQGVTVLRPFEGYWIHNPKSAPLQLRIPPIESVAAPATAGAASRDSVSDSLTWSVHIAVACGTARDALGAAGITPLARDGSDPLDRSEPPMAPGEGISLYFLGSEPGLRRAVDLRSPFPAATNDGAAGGKHWAFDVARSTTHLEPAEASLAFTGLEGVPADIELRLVDRMLDRVVDLRRENTYRYVTGTRGYVTSEAEARFALIAGTAAFIEAAQSGLPGPPARTRLLVPCPNPLAGAGLVRFEVARAGRVTVEVYDLSGRRVRTLADGPREAGRYELVWGGDNSSGQRPAPGVYLLRLSGPDRVDARKVVLIR
ncbi:MAG TPA: FG-GAP-like repeat-containing protein [Candidatus Eisenbacteria bacterium]